MVEHSAGLPPLVIAIDGPSGSGKSSTARGVAARLDLEYLDTGSMYRAMTWLVLDAGIDPTDSVAVAGAVSAAALTISADPHDPGLSVNGVDVTEAIREPRVSAVVSSVATNLEVRADLVARQQAIIAEAVRGIVAEGRDITTVVAPDAQVRVLLVADPDARVARRHAELGERIDMTAVTDQVIRRDQDDATVSAFEQPAPGVHLVDSTSLSLSEVIEVICDFVPAPWRTALAVADGRSRERFRSPTTVRADP